MFFLRLGVLEVLSQFSWETDTKKLLRASIFLLTVRSFYLRLVFVAYRNWPLKEDIHCQNSVRSVLLAMDNRFGLVYSWFSPVRILDLVFFPYGSPTVSRNDEP